MPFGNRLVNVCNASEATYRPISDDQTAARPSVPPSFCGDRSGIDRTECAIHGRPPPRAPRISTAVAVGDRPGALVHVEIGSVLHHIQ
jgi:hypothetical protein